MVPQVLPPTAVNNLYILSRNVFGSEQSLQDIRVRNKGQDFERFQKDSDEFADPGLVGKCRNSRKCRCISILRTSGALESSTKHAIFLDLTLSEAFLGKQPKVCATSSDLVMGQFTHLKLP